MSSESNLLLHFNYLTKLTVCFYTANNITSNVCHKTTEKVKLVMVSKKGKGGPCPMVSLDGVLISLRWALINHKVCDTWPVRRQTYGHLSSLRALPPFDLYQVILLGDRGTWV